jgi:hypothetical protein
MDGSFMASGVQSADATRILLISFLNCASGSEIIDRKCGKNGTKNGSKRGTTEFQVIFLSDLKNQAKNSIKQ